MDSPKRQLQNGALHSRNDASQVPRRLPVATHAYRPIHNPCCCALLVQPGLHVIYDLLLRFCRMCFFEIWIPYCIMHLSSPEPHCPLAEACTLGLVVWYTLHFERPPQPTLDRRTPPSGGACAQPRQVGTLSSGTCIQVALTAVYTRPNV